MASSALALSSTTQPHSPVPPKIFSTSRHQVVCSHGSAIRVATVEQALPLRAATRLLRAMPLACSVSLVALSPSGNHKDDAGVDHEEREVTRDWLRLRYMVDAPCSAIDSLAGVG